MAQAELAIACGVRVLAVGLWERGRSVPRTETVPQIAEALKVDVEWLLTGKGRGLEVEPTGQKAGIS